MLPPLFAISTLGIILLVVVLLLLFGAFPYSQSRGLGYGPPGLLGALLIILLVLVLLGLI